MADQVGCSDSAMKAAVANFNNRVSQFEAAAQQITTDTHALQEAWQGDGYTAFTDAMGKWNTDITNVTTDLQSMGRGVDGSNNAIQEVDQIIKNAFSGFHG